MAKAYKVVEVLRSGRQVSVAPAWAKVIGHNRYVAKELTYVIGAKTEEVRGSCGIFMFPNKCHAIAFAKSESQGRLGTLDNPLAVLACKSGALPKRNYRLRAYRIDDRKELSPNDYQELLSDYKGADYTTEWAPEGTHTTPWVIPLKKVWPKETKK